MRNSFVDLHVHTNFSDGAFTPEEAVNYAFKVGLSAISITDHDIIDGIPAAIKEGEKIGLEIIPGVELSSEVESTKNSEMHILGYFINWKSAQLQESLSLFRNARIKRAHQILEKLFKLGINLNEDHVFKLSGNGAIGRLHIARAMIEEGFSDNISEIFFKYLGIGKPAYIPKLRIKPGDAIKMILRAGGVPVLAHPFYGHYSNRNLLKGLINDGLRGIEVWHSKHSDSVVGTFTRISKELNLIATGGSDCHGKFGDDSPSMGKIKVPYSAVEELKKCKEIIESENSNILTDI